MYTSSQKRIWNTNFFLGQNIKFQMYFTGDNVFETPVPRKVYQLCFFILFSLHQMWLVYGAPKDVII